MTQQSERDPAAVPDSPAPQQSPPPNSAAQPATKSTGRTAWDMLALFFEQRALRPHTNWYRVAFWLLLCGVLVALYIEVKSGLNAFREQVGRIEGAADASRKSAADASATATRIEKSFERTPVLAAQWINLDLDQAACGGKAIEVLTRVGAFDIRPDGTNWYRGSMRNTAGLPSVVVIACTPNKVALLAVSDWDNSAAFQNRESLTKAFAEPSK